MDLVGHRYDHAGVAILALSGELDLATVPRGREHLLGLVVDHPGEIVVVDLTGLAVCDSVGLGALVGAQRRARSRHGELRVVVPGGRLAELFGLTGLDAVLPRYDAVEAAAR